MSHMLDLAALMMHPALLQAGRVLAAADGGLVDVQLPGLSRSLACRVLHSAGSALALEPGDEVLVWSDAQSQSAVVLGRIGVYAQPPQPVHGPHPTGVQPDMLVLEAQGDVVIRNRHARLKLGADGDIEILGTSLTSRSQRLLRLLAPMIKLN